MRATAAASWDDQYASGRYQDDPPVRFTRDVIDAARSRNLRRGLYVGCGNGRNLIPMSDAGLDLVGLDISAALASARSYCMDAAAMQFQRHGCPIHAVRSDTGSAGVTDVRFGSWR